MASIAKDSNGKKRIQFVTPEGRKSLRLGKCSMRQAEAFKTRFENLLAGRLAGGIDDETARWLADLPDDMHAKLAKLGLVKPKTSMRLGEFLEAYKSVSDRRGENPHHEFVAGQRLGGACVDSVLLSGTVGGGSPSLQSGSPRQPENDRAAPHRGLVSTLRDRQHSPSWCTRRDRRRSVPRTERRQLRSAPRA